MEYERMQWKRNLEFLFTTFGYTIGLGNIWRFPYTCYKNGGAAFLIPYFLTLLLLTLPMVFLEMSLGQFVSQGPVKVWAISPMFQGIGWASLFMLLIINIYYITIIMYALYFMTVAFVNIGGTLPWQECGKDWSTHLCRDQSLPDLTSMASRDVISYHMTNMDHECSDKMLLQLSLTRSTVLDMPMKEFHANFSSCFLELTSPEEEYWNRFVLGVHHSNGTHDLGDLIGRNVVLLITVWIIVYYCCLRGIRSIARVIYVTATFPFALLFILLIRGFTLSGYEIGIRYYTEPDWQKLLNLNIWSSASTQAIYSISIAFGSHIALASHNKFKNNVFRDSILISVTNSLTSILSGFVVFAFLGHASYRLNTDIENLFDSGPGLLFISYANGLSQLPGAAVWAALFYMAVFTLGLDSQLVMVWTITSSLQDVFPQVFKKYEKLGFFGLCLFMFLLGLPLVTQGGMHMVVLMDTYLANFSLTLFVILESVLVCWLYGVNNFIRDIEMMIGKKPALFWLYWKITWIFTAPPFCIFIFIASTVSYAPASYLGITINSGGEAIGWLIILSPLVLFFVIAAVQVKRYGGIQAAMKPTPEWRPALEENRIDHYAETYAIPGTDDGCVRSPDEDYLTPVNDDGSCENPGYIMRENGDKYNGTDGDQDDVFKTEVGPIQYDEKDPYTDLTISAM